MAIGIQIEVEGVKELIMDFKKYGARADKAVQTAVDQTALNVESDAKKRLNGMFGSAKHWVSGLLATDIYNRFVSGDKNEKVVGSEKEYAPYIEFGIGDYVDIPEGLESVAAQYKGKKKVKGFKGDSFLNWAVVNQAPKFKERLIKELNKIK